MQINVEINGKFHGIPEGASVAYVVRRYANGSGVAVAVNETFIPRESHHQYRVKEGDRVELLTPMEGG